MPIRKRISGEVSLRKPLPSPGKVKSLEDYLARIPTFGSPQSRVLFNEFMARYVLPFNKKLTYSGYPVTVYPGYRTGLNSESKYVYITSVQVGFLVAQKSHEVIFRLQGNRQGWNKQLFLAVTGLKKDGFTPKV